MWWNSCLSSSVHTWRNSGLCLSFKDSKHFLNRCASFATLLANSITVEENALVRPFPVFVGPFALLYVSSCCFFLRFSLNNICIYASSSSLHWSAYSLLYLFVISCISPSMFLCSWLIYYIMCSSYLVLDSLLYLGSTRVSNPVKKRFWSMNSLNSLLTKMLTRSTSSLLAYHVLQYESCVWPAAKLDTRSAHTLYGLYKIPF